jgi:hypothetical protein
MSNYPPIHFCYERDRERPGGAQCGNDEVFGLIADRQTPERCDRDLGDGAGVSACLTSDYYLVH